MELGFELFNYFSCATLTIVQEVLDSFCGVSRGLSDYIVANCVCKLLDDRRIVDSFFQNLSIARVVGWVDEELNCQRANS